MKAKLNIDYTRSNELEIVDGHLSGKVTGPNGGEIIDAEGKAQAVRDVCAEIGCATAKAIVIGDGANDVKNDAAGGHFGRVPCQAGRT